jgi:hypothetical protein
VLHAHDFWIEPGTFHPAPGAMVTVALRVGQNFVGDPVPRSSSMIERFIVRQAGRDDPVNGLENVDPAGWIRADGETTAVIAYRSRPTFIELPPAKFEEYLRLEGLDSIIDLRTRRGERDKPGRERFFRYAKALLTGARTSTAVTQPVGLGYEIVPDEDPTIGASPFRGRVLYRGAPLTGVLVVAMLQSDPSVRMTMRSDAQGAFSFLLPRPGVWLIKATHMIRASFFSGAEWDSLWASLTFELPEAHSPQGAKSSR